MTKRILTALALAALTAGCTINSGSTDLDPNLALTAAPNQTGVILGSLGDCVVTQEAGIEAAGLVTGILGAVLPKLVDKGVSGLADYLERRRDQREAEFSASSSARGAAELYDFLGKPDLVCLMVYRGQRGTSKAAEGWTADNLTKLGLAAPPEFFLEATLLYSFDGAAMRLVPVRLEYRKTAAKRSSGKKDLLVSGFLEGVFASGDEVENARFGSFQMYFPALAEGTTWSREQLGGISSQWIPLPAPTMDEEGETALSLVPLSAFVNVHETEEQGDLLLGVLDALAGAVSDEKETIAREVEKALSKKLGLATEEESEEEEEE